MSNEIEDVSSKVSVTYEPSKLEIDNYLELKSKVQNYADKYKNIVATDESLSGAKSARAELNKLIKALDDKRKDIKKVYNEPFDSFKNDINSLKEILQDTVDPIDEQITKIEDQQRSERETKVKELINEMAPNYGVDPNSIEIEHSWTNKTMTSTKLAKILKDGFLAMKHKQDTIKANKKLIDEHCKLKGIDSAGWINQVTEGTDIDQLISAIDRSADDKKRAEQAEKNRQAYEKAIIKSKQTQVDDKTVDEETGEIVKDDDQPIDNDEPDNNDEPDKPDSYSMTFEVTGELPVLKELYKFIDSKNLKFSVVKDPSKVSD